jgi:hypothetical protein
MNQVIGVCHERNIIRQFREKYNLRYDCEQLSSGTPRTDSNENNELGAANRGSEPSSSQSTSESEDSGVDSIPSYDRIKIRNDKMLIKAYLKNASRSLHPRRTLDQFYYYMLEDTEERDLDQVVERWVKRIDSRNQYRDMAEAVSSADPNIFMVDQLWLWILKGREDTPVVSDTVITCFPQRWGQSTDDDVLQNILGYLETTDRAPITSMHDLVKLIITSCSNVFDRSRVPKELQFQEFFEGCIGRVVGKTSLQSI